MLVAKDGSITKGLTANTINVGDVANPVFTEVALGTGKTAIQISAGAYYTCALLNDHTAKCWGDNSSNQLGQNNINFTHDGTFNIGNKPNQLGDNLPAIFLAFENRI